jgi:drug/metabolite transporter (DMT)-like permease
MSFASYLYFSFVLVSIFLILEVTKNFKHSLLLKIQFIGALTFAIVINLFLFKGPLTEIELSIVTLVIDLMPMFVLNIALILYAYKIPAWVFIVEVSVGIIGGVLVGVFTSPVSTNFVHSETFQFYAIASTPNLYLKIFRQLLLLAYQTGVITDRGTGHHYWSSDFSDVTFARAYVIFPPNTYTVSGNNRLAGFSVRCIKD